MNSRSLEEPPEAEVEDFPAAPPASAPLSEGAGDGRSAGSTLLPEIELLLCCARARLEPGTRQRVLQLLDSGIDHDRLVQTAHQHKMLPLLYWHLKSIPGVSEANAPMRVLQEVYLRSADRSLELMGRLVQIVNLFGSHGIPVAPYKGPVLSVQLYGNITLRQVGDLDILIRRQDLPRARELLLANGYGVRHSLTEGVRTFLHASRYCEDFSDPNGTKLEVHWRFASGDIDFPLTLEDLIPAMRVERISGQKLAVLRGGDLLLILCLHGAKHRWDRLEWIAGIGELLRQAEWSWDELLVRADELNARFVLLLGCLLAHDLVQAPLPQHVLDHARSERWIVRLARDVQDRITGKRGADSGLAGVLSRNLFQLPLQQGARRRWRYFTYRVTTPNRHFDWRAVTVGGVTIPLHALTWPLRLVGKTIRRAVRVREPRK